MSTQPLLMMILMSTSAMCFLMNSWISMWIMLELNTLAFCSMNKNYSSNKKASESSMKYFIIQSVASATLVFSSSMMNMLGPMNLFMSGMATLSLMVKMASAPLHQWLINMINKVKKTNSYLLLTWQKLAPLALVSYQTKSMLYPFVIATAIVGCFSQLNKTNVMTIMAFSSVFNLSWMIMTILMNMKLMLVFCSVYWISVILTLNMMFMTKMKKINTEMTQSMNKWIYLLIMANLASMPPTANFSAKWMILSEMIMLKSITLITFFLIISSVNLYIYLRLSNFGLLKETQNKQKPNKKSNKMLMAKALLVNLFALSMLFV